MKIFHAHPLFLHSTSIPIFSASFLSSSMGGIRDGAVVSSNVYSIGGTTHTLPMLLGGVLPRGDSPPQTSLR